MNSKLFKLFAISVFFIGMASCKKGENDPAFSIYSRKTRITGLWKLESGQDYAYTYSGSLKTDKYGSVTYSEIIEINGDGTFSYTEEENGNRYTSDGYWTFGRRIKEKGGTEKLKDKSYLVLYFGSPAGQSSTLIIDELRNKKMAISSNDGNYVKYYINLDSKLIDFERFK
jgi:hypothetical protein